MHVVRGAVDGIDDPGRRRIGTGFCLRREVFLAEKLMIGKAPSEKLEDGFLRGDVGIGNEIGPPLLTDGELGGQISSTTAARLAASLAASRYAVNCFKSMR